MVGLVVVLSIRRDAKKSDSQVAKMQSMNLLPGGLNSTPAQEKLRVLHANAEAEKAEVQAKSYTPSMPGSQPMSVHEVGLEKPAVADQPAPAIHMVMPSAPLYTPPEKPAPAPRQDEMFDDAPKVQKVSMTTPDPNADPGLTPERRKAYDTMMAQWDIQPMRTTVVLPERIQEERESAARVQAGREAVSNAGPNKGKLLVPAGRGVYAHTVLSVNSDSGGPIVLEADTGPLMGDRMIGTFAKSGNDRLVVRISRVEHHGEPLEVAGLVVAPDSMETSVASNIDQHYVERFALPAAAAFIQGIGQAASMSNTSTTVSPYGSTTSVIGRMSVAQQGWIAAGAAASAVGHELTQSTPKGPTIHLDANIGVGVMFLDNVVQK
jgi:intracellular multiplication protein IcmE